MTKTPSITKNLFLVLFADYRSDERYFGCTTYLAMTYREVKQMFFQEFRDEPVIWQGMEMLQYGFGAV